MMNNGTVKKASLEVTLRIQEIWTIKHAIQFWLQHEQKASFFTESEIVQSNNRIKNLSDLLTDVERELEDMKLAEE